MLPVRNILYALGEVSISMKSKIILLEEKNIYVCVQVYPCSCICMHTYIQTFTVGCTDGPHPSPFASSLESSLGGMQNEHRPCEFSSLVYLDAQKQQSSIKESVLD